MFKHYLQITKPGIIMGNLISVAGGFFLAARGEINWILMLATVVGLSLVVASGCVLNNYLDRDIDAKMQRTQNRVTVTGEISGKAAFLHGIVLGLIGFGLITYFTNWVSVILAVFGYFVYVGLYTMYFKRHSIYGTLIGSLSGAVPPVVGYCAASGQFDAGAIILLAMFCIWQMPHSYAIAIFRYKDYATANIPTLPVSEGIGKTKCHIILYIAAFAMISALLPLAGYVGIGFMIVALATSTWWLGMALRGYRKNVDINDWARQVFLFSIITVTSLSITMSLDFRVQQANLLVFASVH